MNFFNSVLEEYCDLATKYTQLGNSRNQVVSNSAENQALQVKLNLLQAEIAKLKHAPPVPPPVKFSSANLGGDLQKKLNWIQSVDVNFTPDSEMDISDTYENLYELYRKNECCASLTGYTKFAKTDLTKNAKIISEKYAQEFISVEHVFLVLKNIIRPNDPRNAVRFKNFVTAVKDYNLAADKDPALLQEIFEAKNDFEIKKKFNFPEMTSAYTKLRTASDGFTGYNILGFYKHDAGEFILDPVIEDPDKKINVVTLPGGPTIRNFLLNHQFKFTFTKVFNGLKEENQTNLYEAISKIQEGVTNPLTMITFGQSGSGKSTTAMDILYKFVRNKPNYTYSAIQWYLCMDEHNILQTQLHDLGKVINQKELGNYKYRFKVESEPLAETTEHENKQFDFENLLDITKITKNLVTDFQTNEMLNLETGRTASLNFQARLERVKLTRSTGMNLESSRSILFFTIYDESNNAKYSLIDLPGNEELSLTHSGASVTQRQKETASITPVLELFKSLFLAKKMSISLDQLAGYSQKNDLGLLVDEGTTAGLTNLLETNESFGDFSAKLNLLSAPMMEIFNSSKSKLVLLLTSYGVTVCDKLNPASKLDRVIKTSKDTFEFAARLAATNPTPCPVEIVEKLTAKIGGKGTRKRSTRIRLSRRKYLKH